ncbi:MAG TPA: arginine deiminase family protein [Gemmatimonadaceae bacterium]|nr:arginine deiminase family protein [Gemmatimonadaceae bacterium]
MPPTLAECQLTHVDRQPIDVVLASAQHGAYERLLEELGCTVRRLTSTPELPDSVFVEDTAIVLDECAVIARPGAASRRAETESVAEVLSGYREVEAVAAPATLDGGDVLRIDRTLYVGLSTRTNAEGARQLAGKLAPYGYRVETVVARDCLHLKSAVSSLGDGRLLLDRQSVDPEAFGLSYLEVDRVERFAANVLSVAGTVIVPATAPRTRERLGREGYTVRTLNVSELAKAEAGLTCCSLIFDA